MTSTYYHALEDQIEAVVQNIQGLLHTEYTNVSEHIARRRIWWIHLLRRQLHDYRDIEQNNLFAHKCDNSYATLTTDVDANKTAARDLVPESLLLQNELQAFKREVRNDTDANPQRLQSRTAWATILRKNLQRYQEGEDYGVYHEPSNTSTNTTTTADQSLSTKKQPTSQTPHSSSRQRKGRKRKTPSNNSTGRAGAMSKATQIEHEMSKIPFRPKSINCPVYDPKDPPTITRTGCPPRESLGEPCTKFKVGAFAFAKYCPVNKCDQVEHSWHDVNIIRIQNRGTRTNPNYWYTVTDALAGRKAITDNVKLTAAERRFHYWKVPGYEVSQSQ